ncbi:helix-turn-helix domain-containing protein [Microbacterium sp. R1]|uniref:DNA binding protein n=1 Tax=Microbacterium phage vB_MoxS-R1 TaxID=2848881 RepID=A0A8F2E5G3_9CAUD|nr:helix-turn-helix domain-containing protein [Microbacterium sp. R1]YP_010649907.1 DNA binding protein [Microbacterium phage vB_MoxS-R1]MBE7953599.1 helix-turn-helix domain-containing protein [Microbacterium sp. R1]QWT28877.1 DNA binding protein [Microbacterium phage vB_MoxS-R1]
MIPVTINLPPATFNRLEKIAATRGISMRELIVAGLEPKPITKVTGSIPSAHPNGYTQLSDDQWAEILRLRAAKWTVPQLAVKFGCSSSTIYKRLQKRANS